MKRTVEFAAMIALLASVTMLGCTADSLPLEPAHETSGSFFNRAPAPGFDVLRRNAPLPTDLTITRVIGPEGGRMVLSDAGVTFIVPPNALTEATEITLTAPAGDAVAFNFAPHGLQFIVPASIHVRASATDSEHLVNASLPNGAVLDRFMGVYFTDDVRDGVDPLENLATYLLDGDVVFEIGHFSGYACASG